MNLLLYGRLIAAALVAVWAFPACCLLPKSKYPGHEKEFRQYHMSHSNPYVVPGYMPAERRKQLKQQYKSGRIEAPTLSGGEKDSGTPRTTDEKTDVGKV